MLPDLEEKNMDLEKPTVSPLAHMEQSYSNYPGEYPGFCIPAIVLWYKAQVYDCLILNFCADKTWLKLILLIPWVSNDFTVSVKIWK